MKRNLCVWAGIGTVMLTLAGVSAARADAPKAEFPMQWTYADDPAQFKTLQKLVGKHAPALKTSGWIGESQNLDDLKGDIVLIDFWATWCGPCIAAIPHTNEIAEQYESKGVTVFGVCCTRGAEKMSNTVKTKGMKYPTAADTNGASAQAFGVQWWPFYVLIDREGVIRATGLRPDKVSTALDELLKEQPYKGDSADTDKGKTGVDEDLLESSQPGDRRRLADIEGKPAPNLVLADWLNTEPMTNESLKGKLVVLDFWGTWCGPCMASIDHNIEVAEKFKDKGVVFIGVSTKKGADRVPAVVKAREIAYPVAIDTTGATIDAYKVNGYPDYYIIGRDGNLLMADVKNTEIDAAIEAALKLSPAE